MFLYKIITGQLQFRIQLTDGDGLQHQDDNMAVSKGGTSAPQIRDTSDLERKPCKSICNKELPTNLKARQNVIKTLALVALGFVLCTTWNQVYTLIRFSCNECIGLSGNFYNFSIAALNISSCLNPIIYCLTWRKFQAGVRWVFCKHRIDLIQEVIQSGLSEQKTSPQSSRKSKR